MAEEESPKSKNGESTTELRIARIGLISAVVVAACGLIGTLITVLGTAISAYFSARAVQVPVELPIRATQTAEARLVTGILPTRTPGEAPSGGGSNLLVKNRLVLPVQIYIDDIYQGDLPASSQQAYLLEDALIVLRWELVRETTESGRPIGDEMRGMFTGVSPGQVIEITNQAGDQEYFYPSITNRTSMECSIIINQGWESENDPGAVLPANSEDVGLGYYKLFTNSNVSLDCGGALRWWGLQPDEASDDSFYEDVLDGPGTITFTLKE